jgi:uncharacterized protein (TIGR02569 family)
VIPGPVLAAFGLPRDVPIRPVGRVVVAEHLVLKQVEDEAESVWVAETLAALRPVGYRVARPVRAADGRWIFDGWAATERVAGNPAPARRHEVLAAGRVFHRAIAHLPRPVMLDQRTHLWARADRLAWGEEVPTAGSELVDALLARLQPVTQPAQVVHGDLGGNVLFASGLPPAIIDFSPYFRPPGWALAVVVVDAVVWGRAGFELVDALEPDEREQMLARATLFRLFCGEPSGPHQPWVGHLCRLLDG